LAQQMEWLQRAQRHADDPPAELEILDGYLALYPRGLLRGEVQVARVDALLREGEKAHAIDALDELHRQGFAGLPRGGELSVLRAELLAQADRCAEALPDLQESTGRAAALAERVLYARAYCLSRTGDAAGSRHGYQDYLRRFPKGRFAAQAHQALGE
jgi:TolA-binding protein